MYVGQDFLPVDTVENAVYGVDFIDDLPSGDTISTATVTCSNAAGTQVTDPSPSSRIIAGPFINGSQVTARFAYPIAGVNYLLQFVVTTGNGDTLSLFSHIMGEEPF